MAGGGVGEAMLIGAAVGATAGGAGAAIQGGDPLKGALVGGVMGAAGGGIGGAAAAPAATTATTAGAGAGTGGGFGLTAGSGSGAATGSIYGGAGSGINAATQVGSSVSGAGTGGGFGLTAGSGMPTAASSLYGGTSGIGAGAGTTAAGGFGIAAPTSTIAAVPSGAGAGTAGGTAGATGGTEVAGKNIFGYTPGQEGYLSNTTLGMTAGTSALSGAMGAERDMYGNPPTDSYEGGNLKKLKYDPDKFTASSPTYAPASVYRPTYAAEGGIMKLANGGMPGPVERMSANALGGSTNMFPQSQQERTNFATPTQMPASAEVTMDNQYRGVTMARGGITRFADGGLGSLAAGMPSGGSGAGAQAMADQGIAALGQAGKKRMLTKEQMDAIAMQGMTKAGLQDVYGQMAAQELAKGGTAGNKDMAAIDAYMAAAQGGDMATVAAKAQAGDYNAMIALNKIRNTPNQNYAGGGYLGGYSDGGRMLKGPGDGMSDNIPATIAGKQPARLADGEFVVPADVVSHLGNGSTDAGAKQLYAMMNRVRKARTGNPKQGKQIKPAKYMAA